MAGTVGHLGRERALPGVALLAAGTMLAALGLSACGPDTAHARTVLRSPRAATVELASGASRPASDGMTVPKGATVRTAPGGSASLVAAGRTVLLGSSTAVSVIDGEREELRSGLVFVDARRAPGVSLAAGAATVVTARGALARVERGALLRAVSYRQELVVRATGRRAEVTVRALHQRQVPDGGLPGPETALALTHGDLWERSYVLDLVTADDDLNALADGLDRNPTSSSAVLRAVPASYAGADASQPASETALAFVIARAARSRDFATIRHDREDGGSWGVVAALARADVAAVSAALDAVLNPTEGPAVLAAAGAPIGPSAGAPGGPGIVPPVTTTTAASPAPGTSTTRRPRPRPSPSASQDPVQQVVTTVTGLLPSPSPTPVSVPLVPGTPSPSPLVSVRVGGATVGLG